MQKWGVWEKGGEQAPYCDCNYNSTEYYPQYRSVPVVPPFPRGWRMGSIAGAGTVRHDGEHVVCAMRIKGRATGAEEGPCCESYWFRRSSDAMNEEGSAEV